MTMEEEKKKRMAVIVVLTVLLAGCSGSREVVREVPMVMRDTVLMQSVLR